MKFKTGVSPNGLRRPIREKLDVIDLVWKRFTGEDEATCTSTVEGKHSVPRSTHYKGDAVDLRVWYVNGDDTIFVDKEEYAGLLRDALGDDFVVFVEPTHVHVHWAPIYREEVQPHD